METETNKELLKDFNNLTEKQQQEILNNVNELAFKNECNTLIPFKHLAFTSVWKDEVQKTISIDADREAVKFMLAKYPATDTSIEIGNDKREILTPYYMAIDNVAQQSQFSKHSLLIHYKSKDINIRLKINISEIIDFVKTYNRNITESEHHYFIGYSHNKLRTMQVMAYNFNKEQVNFYGGSKVLIDTDEINTIIEHLIK